jgi:hypothetical protein
MKTTTIEKATTIFQQHSGLLRTSQAIRLGIAPRTQRRRNDAKTNDFIPSSSRHKIPRMLSNALREAVTGDIRDNEFCPLLCRKIRVWV